MERVKEIVEKDFKGKVDFVAQNVKTADFGDPVFAPYVIRTINGVPCAIVGQAFPYTPIANPRYMVADWSFGIQDDNLQKVVDEARAKGAQVVVVLSHNGMDVDLKMASRVRGIDAILGRHTHDGMPVPVLVKNAGGTTLVTNAGSNGKFLGVLDFEVKDGKVADFRYKLLPVFANQLTPDAEMAALIKRVRAPYEAKLAEKLAVTDGLLYRRGNFNGSWDQLLCDALIDAQQAQIAFSPGFRWGTSLLPGDVITRELLMDQVATTYSYATVTPMTGETIKTRTCAWAERPSKPARPTRWPAGRRFPRRRSPPATSRSGTSSSNGSRPRVVSPRASSTHRG
jgi:sulfur-oxidizing protein SoxB